MVKPQSATACSKETPWPPWRKYSREAAMARRSSSLKGSSSTGARASFCVGVHGAFLDAITTKAHIAAPKENSQIRTQAQVRFVD